jgi:hypothetical protein
LVTQSLEPYWQVTNLALELAWDLVLDRNQIPTEHVERLLDVEPELLGRALINIAAAQILLIAEAAGLDLRRNEVLNVLVIPLDVFDVVATVPSGWDEFAKRAWNAIQHQQNTTEGDPFTVHPSFQYSASPSAMILNSAMPVITHLLHKVTVLQPRTRPGETSRPLDPRDPRSTTADAMAAVRARLDRWLKQ